MDLSALQLTTLPYAALQAADPAPAPGQPTYQEVASNLTPSDLPTAGPDFEATFTPVAATQVDPTSELLEEDIAARTAEALVAQQSVVDALHAGADTSVLLSGLPPGATATLLGGGWAQAPPGAAPADASEQILAYFFPFRPRDVPAVASSSKAESAREQGRRAPEKPAPRTYGRAGEEEEPILPPESTLDILD
jgi:hypothetical protein